MRRFVFIILVLLVGFGIFIADVLYISDEETLAMELSEKIEEFKKETGHYPNCDNSADLIDSLSLNGNEWYPEYFSYHLDNGKKYYLIKMYIHDKEVYDSRTKRLYRQK